jgi:hypothetical protein
MANQIKRYKENDSVAVPFIIITMNGSKATEYKFLIIMNI